MQNIAKWCQMETEDHYKVFTWLSEKNIISTFDDPEGSKLHSVIILDMEYIASK